MQMLREPVNHPLLREGGFAPACLFYYILKTILDGLRNQGMKQLQLSLLRFESNDCHRHCS